MVAELGPLPSPAAEGLARSTALGTRIREAIDDGGGAIDFARYMEMALYTPGLGYYSGAGSPFGSAGDFITAPEISALFGQCLAAYLAPVLGHLGDADVLEFGPGSGALAVAVLNTLATLDRVPRRYRMLELSGTLAAAQRTTLEALDGPLRERVEWLDRLPATGLRGCFIANEVADAIPFRRLRIGRETVQEWRVAWQDGGPAWALGPLRDDGLAAAVARLRPFLAADSLPYDTEVAPARRAWLASAAATLREGAMVVLDYGFERRELCRAGRHGGTMACHYRHHTHDDPLILPGLQDITSHVDFTDLAEAAVDAGLDVAGFTTQAQFLLGQGLLERAAAAGADLSLAALARSGEIKRLTLPGEMGEVFKVLALGRQLPPGLLTFPGRDMRARL
ncbi:MAG: SAM-dependent methyltransferase [Gammaproteobacteria bacterium]|nr:SAM-dependent methyltransferase [Gammaproteobacteria bacterium]